jgi:hypothetical protein
MTTERRFNDQEVAEVIERATGAQSAALSQPALTDGVTLAQLQEIGREIGIAPEAMASAVRSLDLADRRTVRRLLGLPVGVSLTANLGRQLSDQEWQRLVVDLRETFDARGRVREEGAFRQWSNGNLHVMVEPTPEGNQVRLRTFKSEGPVYIGFGLGLVALAAVAFVAKVMAGADTAPMMQKFLPVAFIGAGLTFFGAFQLPRWARERRAQMESIIARLRSAPCVSQPTRRDGESSPP